MPKIELGQISVQMGFTHVVECAVNASFQQGKIRLNVVCVLERATYIILGAVVDRAVARKFFANLGVDGAFVRHQI